MLHLGSMTISECVRHPSDMTVSKYNIVTVHKIIFMHIYIYIYIYAHTVMHRVYTYIHIDQSNIIHIQKHRERSIYCIERERKTESKVFISQLSHFFSVWHLPPVVPNWRRTACTGARPQWWQCECDTAQAAARIARKSGELTWFDNHLFVGVIGPILIHDLTPFIGTSERRGKPVVSLVLVKLANGPKTAQSLHVDVTPRRYKAHDKTITDKSASSFISHLFFVFDWKKQDEAHEPECRHVCWETEI